MPLLRLSLLHMFPLWSHFQNLAARADTAALLTVTMDVLDSSRSHLAFSCYILSPNGMRYRVRVSGSEALAVPCLLPGL